MCDNGEMGKRVMSKPKMVRNVKKARGQFELLGGAAAVVSGLLVISIFLVSSLDSVLVRSQQYASVLAAVLTDLANGDRVKNRLDHLVINEKLTAAAQLKANDMASHSYFAHVSPAGVEPWHWFKEAGYDFTYAGENLAIDFADSEDVNSAWMNSPTHRANLLDQHFTEIGIATAEGFYQGHPTTFVVQEFGAPISVKTAKATVDSPVVAATEAISRNSTQPATAIAGAPSRVLGESNVPSPQKVATQVSPLSKKTAGNEKPAASVTPDMSNQKYASALAYVAASPRTTLFNVYFYIAAFFLIGLVFLTGFEIHFRHMKKAVAAGSLLVLMSALFAVGNWYVFPEPLLPDSNQVASAIGTAHR